MGGLSIVGRQFIRGGLCAATLAFGVLAGCFGAPPPVSVPLTGSVGAKSVPVAGLPAVTQRHVQDASASSNGNFPPRLNYNTMTFSRGPFGRPRVPILDGNGGFTFANNYRLQDDSGNQGTTCPLNVTPENTVTVLNYSSDENDGIPCTETLNTSYFYSVAPGGTYGEPYFTIYDVWVSLIASGCPSSASGDVFGIYAYVTCSGPPIVTPTPASSPLSSPSVAPSESPSPSPSAPVVPALVNNHPLISPGQQIGQDSTTFDITSAGHWELTISGGTLNKPVDFFNKTGNMSVPYSGVLPDGKVLGNGLYMVNMHDDKSGQNLAVPAFVRSLSMVVGDGVATPPAFAPTGISSKNFINVKVLAAPNLDWTIKADGHGDKTLLSETGTPGTNPIEWFDTASNSSDPAVQQEPQSTGIILKDGEYTLRLLATGDKPNTSSSSVDATSAVLIDTTKPVISASVVAAIHMNTADAMLQDPSIVYNIH